MSFLYQSSRSMMRSAQPLVRAARPFSTTIATRKTATEAVKDGVKKVDRTVANAAVAGIEKGEELSAKAKEIYETASQKADGKTAEVSGKAKGTAAELKGEAKGKAEEIKGKI